MSASASQERTKARASASMSANSAATAEASNAAIVMNTERFASKLNGARRNPMAEPTPAPSGIRQRAMPSFSHKRAACSGAAPPKATIVYPPRSSPFSTA